MKVYDLFFVQSGKIYKTVRMTNNSGEGLFLHNGSQERGNMQFFARNGSELVRKLNREECMMVDGVGMSDTDIKKRWFLTERGARKYKRGNG